MMNGKTTECLSLSLDHAWEVSMPLPKLNHAKQYKRILWALGNETAELEEVSEGWIVRWRPRQKRA